MLIDIEVRWNDRHGKRCTQELKTGTGRTKRADADLYAIWIDCECEAFLMDAYSDATTAEALREDVTTLLAMAVLTSC